MDEITWAEWNTYGPLSEWIHNFADKKDRLEAEFNVDWRQRDIIELPRYCCPCSTGDLVAERAVAETVRKLKSAQTQESSKRSRKTMPMIDEPSTVLYACHLCGNDFQDRHGARTRSLNCNFTLDSPSSNFATETERKRPVCSEHYLPDIHGCEIGRATPLARTECEMSSTIFTSDSKYQKRMEHEGFNCRDHGPSFSALSAGFRYLSEASPEAVRDGQHAISAHLDGRLTVSTISSEQDDARPRDLEERCLHSLAFPSMDSRRLGIDEPAEETCKWLFDHSLYQQWDSRNEACMPNSLLWIKGKPGSGKYTLMKRLVEPCLIEMCSTTSKALPLVHEHHQRLEPEDILFYRKMPVKNYFPEPFQRLPFSSKAITKPLGRIKSSLSHHLSRAFLPLTPLLFASRVSAIPDTGSHHNNVHSSMMTSLGFSPYMQTLRDTGGFLISVSCRALSPLYLVTPQSTNRSHRCGPIPRNRPNQKTIQAHSSSPPFSAPPRLRCSRKPVEKMLISRKSSLSAPWSL